MLINCANNVDHKRDMGLQENIRRLVDQVLDSNIKKGYSTDELSIEIYVNTEQYYSTRQIYESIKDMDYDGHKYVKTVTSTPYTYQRMR